MTRYQALRKCGCDPVAAGFVAALNWLLGVRPGVIQFIHITIEYEENHDHPI